MSWYSKTITSSVRDEKSDQINNLIERLEEAIDGCGIDKENSKSIVENVIGRIHGKTQRSLIPNSLKIKLDDILKSANETLLDSPSKFEAMVYEAVFTLEDHLSAIESK